MTHKEVTDAVECAYEILKARSSSWCKSEASGFKRAILWESIVASGALFVRPLATGSETRFVLQMPNNWKNSALYDDEQSARLIDRARNGDAAARYVLCDTAAKFLEKGCPLPTRLCEYVVDVLRSTGGARQARRGRNPYAKHTRNFDIALAVREVMELGFSPTKNRATEAESACSIVSKALNKLSIESNLDIALSDVAVEKIWQRFTSYLR